VARVLQHHYVIDDARDHGATLSIYMRDVDGNGIELYYDRPRSQWFDSQRRPIVKSEAFDVQKWLHRFAGQSALVGPDTEADISREK
jgi:catechol 2,3-dioxygenase